MGLKIHDCIKKIYGLAVFVKHKFTPKPNPGRPSRVWSLSSRAEEVNSDEVTRANKPDTDDVLNKSSMKKHGKHDSISYCMLGYTMQHDPDLKPHNP